MCIQETIALRERETDRQTVSLSICDRQTDLQTERRWRRDDGKEGDEDEGETVIRERSGNERGPKERKGKQAKRKARQGESETKAETDTSKDRQTDYLTD